MGLLPLLIAILACVIAYKLWRIVQDNKLKHIPGPSLLTKLPILGHGYLLGEDPIKNLTKMNQKYGDIFRLDIGKIQPTVWVCSYELITKMSKSNSFLDRPWDKLETFRETLATDSKGNNNSILPAA